MATTADQSDAYTLADQSDAYTLLRQQAESQLQAGTARARGQWSLSVDALQLLHRLSSNPESAADALRLLHELQVHQVELDLQHEEIVANEQTMIEELRRYRTHFDEAPVGYLLVNKAGEILQANNMAARYFAIECEALEGQRIETLLRPHNRAGLRDLLSRATAGDDHDESGSMVVEGAGTGDPWHIMATPASLEPEAILLTLCPCSRAA